MVAVMLSSVVVAAAFMAIMIGLRTMDNTNKRIAGSNDTQLVAGYFTSDVASAASISTTGTTLHPAPSVNAPNGGQLLSFWTLKTTTDLTPPDSMARLWNKPSTGPSPLTVALADEKPSSAGATDARVGESSTGTSGLNQSIALAPSNTVLPNITRNADPLQAAFANSTAGGSTLNLKRPSAAQNGDLLLAQVAVVGGTANAVANYDSSAWQVVDTGVAGTGVRSIIYSHVAAATDPPLATGWTWTFSRPGEAAGGIVAYTGASSASAHTQDYSPCGGDTPVLLLSWTDRRGGAAGEDIPNEVSYNFVPDGSENTLVRRHCTGTSGKPVDTQTLARALAPTASAVAECQPVVCGPLTSPVNVTLTLTEPPEAHSSLPRTYQLRGTTRTTQ
jgi:hypothetical protein